MKSYCLHHKNINHKFKRMEVTIKDRKKKIEYLRMACNMAELEIQYPHADLIIRLQNRLKKRKGKFRISDGVEIHSKWTTDWEEYFKELPDLNDSLDSLKAENDALKTQLSKYESRSISKMDFPEPNDLIISEKGIPYKVLEGSKIRNLLTNGVEDIISSIKEWKYCV